MINRLISKLLKFYEKIRLSRNIKSFRKYYKDKESLTILKNCLKWINTRKDFCFLKYAITRNETIRIEEIPDGYKELVILYRNDDYLLKYTRLLINHSVWKDKTIFILEEQMSEVTKLQSCLVISLFKPDSSCDIDVYYPPNGGKLIGHIGNQYYDVFEPDNEEYIVDGGAFDGQTAIDYISWGGDKVKKIYSFESDPKNLLNCKERLENLSDDRIQLIGKGLYSSNTSLAILDGTSGTGSTLSGNNQGTSTIEVCSLDSELNEEKVTLIKMDIEGSELDALKGAQEIIKKYHPRLEICVYHKRYDLYEIPQYILSLVPEYRFYLRHYSANFYETVLYASVD